jgi:hypothetical protein
MTNDEKLEALRMELARQDAALDNARQQMEAFADLRIEVPESWLRELEDACAPQGMVPTALVIGIRG